MAKELYPKVIGHKRLPRPSKRRILVVESDEQFVARMKREYGEKLVETCLERITFDPDLDLGLDKYKLLDCLNSEIQRCRPKPAKDMKKAPRKDSR
jgi:hypothetical protein